MEECKTDYIFLFFSTIFVSDLLLGFGPFVSLLYDYVNYLSDLKTHLNGSGMTKNQIFYKTKTSHPGLPTVIVNLTKDKYRMVTRDPVFVVSLSCLSCTS